MVNMSNGKKYVGQAVNLLKRNSIHSWALRNNKHFNTHLQRAFNDVGSDRFEYYVLAYCDAAQLNDCEKKWISFLDSMNSLKGYNRSSGGRLSSAMSEETKSLLSLQRKGHYVSPETKRKIGVSNKGKVRSQEVIDNLKRGWDKRRAAGNGYSPMKGRKLTEDHKLKLSLAHKGKKASAATRAKLSAMRKGNKNGCCAKWTDERRVKMKAMLTGNKFSLGQKQSEETKRRKEVSFNNAIARRRAMQESGVA